MAMFALYPELKDVHTVGVLKGLAFVSVTGLILFLLLRRERRLVRKREQEKARLEEEREDVLDRLRLHIERMPMGHIITDRDFRFVSLNPAAERMFGFSEAEVRGRSPYGLIIPEEAREFVEEVRQQWMQGRLDAHGSNVNVTKDGGRIMCDWFNTPVMDSAGRFDRLVSIVQNITDRRQAEQDIETSRAKLRELTARLDEVREEERVILSREIHDGLGQLLTAMKIDVSLLRRFVDGRHPAGSGNVPGVPGKETPSAGSGADGVADVLDSLTRLTDSTIAQTRDIARRLRSGALEDVFLSEAIRTMARETLERAGVRSRLLLPDERLPITHRQRLALYRIAQEALTNVIRHAGATHAVITLSAAGGLVVLEISDNGIGIGEIGGRETLGLVGMRERAELFGGFCHILPGDQGGTVVHVEMPMQIATATEAADRTAAAGNGKSQREDSL